MSSRHEGVSCDSCLQGNFRGKRYKCLICYDYDLCSTCFEAGVTSPRHTADHPMQCILTRADFDLYYGGEGLTPDQPQSLTCPCCGKLGFVEASLQYHVTVEHSEFTQEVVCPVCAAMPLGDPNYVTDDLAGHLAMEHRNNSREIFSFLEEPTVRQGTRRGVPPPRAVASRARHSINLISASSLNSGRENVDPIAELLNQLSGVRRNPPANATQLQRLQVQLQMARQQVGQTGHQLERAGAVRRPLTASNVTAVAPMGVATTSSTHLSSSSSNDSVTNNPKFLLKRFLDKKLSENDLQKLELLRANRSVFTRYLLYSALGTPEDSSESKTILKKLPGSNIIKAEARNTPTISLK